jgi:hypothetical protein
MRGGTDRCAEGGYACSRPNNFACTSVPAASGVITPCVGSLYTSIDNDTAVHSGSPEISPDEHPCQ